jgi:hypothetical protein
MTDRLSKLRRLDLSRFGMLIALHLLAVTLVAIVAGIRSVGSLRSIGDTDDTVQPKAMQGVLDLRGYRMAASRAVELNGEWSWYGSKLLEPGNEAALADGFVPVPSEWRNVRLNGGPLPSQGYGTYRLHVLLPETLQHQVLGLYIPSVASAYRLWVNGAPLASNGTVGTSVGTMVPKNYPKVVYVYPDGTATLDILIQVSNFVQRKGGLWQPIKLGSVDPIMHERNGNMFYEVFIVGSLLMMSLYHVGLYLTRKRNGSALFFAIVCTSIAVRTLFLGETLAVYFIPELDWEWGVKAEYISAELALWGLLYFLHAQYPQESSRIVRLAVTAVVVYCIVNQLLSPARAYTELFFYFQYGFVLPVVFYMLVVYVLAARRRRPGSIINLIGLLAIGAAIVHDTLAYTRLHTGVDLVPLGFLAYLLTQSVQLSMSCAS